MSATPTEAALSNLYSTYGVAMATLRSARQECLEEREKVQQTARQLEQRRLAEVRTRSTTQLTQLETGTRDLATRLLGRGPVELAVAEHVGLGRLALPDADLGVHHDVSVACVVPLLGRSNLVVHAPEETGTAIARSAIVQVLERTAPGQLRVVCFDPQMSGVLSPFAEIKDVAPEALRTISSVPELENEVSELVQEVHRINDLLGGGDVPLVEQRQRSGASIAGFVLLVLARPEDGLDADLQADLKKLARVGPAVGISQLWLTSGSQPASEWTDDAALARVSHVVQQLPGGVTWLEHPAYRLLPDTPGIDDLRRRTQQVVGSYREGSTVEVAFDEVQELGSPWPDDSARGLTFAVGRSGTSPVEITLGDSREQKNNILITGAAGNGKSNLVKVIIFSLCQRYSPDELELVLLDFKDGATLFPMAPSADAPDFLPHARVLGLESDQEFGLAVLSHVQREISKRIRLIRPHGEDISQYRAAVPDARMPRMVVIIDEFQGLLAETEDGTGEEAGRILERIAKQGRAAGVHLILASQTISGISTLLAREDGIYAQFPVRLALKNSESESMAGLSFGNVAAARLAGRGMAIVNREYGAVSANSQAVIAHLPSSEGAALQKQWWAHVRDSVSPPVVVDGSQLQGLRMHLDALHQLRARTSQRRQPPSALLGRPLAVAGTPFTVALSADPGRHLALLGAGEDDTYDEDDPDTGASEHLALGMLQAAAVSLALQDPSGEATFVAIDLMDEHVSTRGNQALWLDLMERLGFPVQRVGREDLPGFLADVAGGLTTRQPGETTYLLGLNLDRASNLEVPDAFANKPVDALREIMRVGPVHGVHLLGWWANLATFKSQIGFDGEGLIDVYGILRVDQNAAQEVLGPFVRWAAPPHRALLSDRTQASPRGIIPFAPVTQDDIRAVLAEEWG